MFCVLVHWVLNVLYLEALEMEKIYAKHLTEFDTTFFHTYLFFKRL